MLQNNITKDYKKARQGVIENVGKKDKEIANKLELSDRNYATCKKEVFYTLKDHKDNFKNNPKIRLLNPPNPELSKIIEQILSKIILKVKEKSKLKQWKNSKSVIDWFFAIDDKNRNTFIQFNICDF